MFSLRKNSSSIVRVEKRFWTDSIRIPQMLLRVRREERNCHGKPEKLWIPDETDGRYNIFFVDIKLNRQFRRKCSSNFRVDLKLNVGFRPKYAGQKVVLTLKSWT